MQGETSPRGELQTTPEVVHGQGAAGGAGALVTWGPGPLHEQAGNRAGSQVQWVEEA